MTHTRRFCNDKHSPLFEHPYRFEERHKCSWCQDPQASKHRRENSKIEIRRELENFSKEEPLFPHFPCPEWHEYIYLKDQESCMMEVKRISTKKAYAIK